MRHQGKERTTDIPLSSAAIETLALEAMSRDLAPAELRADFGFSDKQKYGPQDIARLID